MKKKIAIINGPNLNKLGNRQVGLYGSVSAEELKNKLFQLGDELNVEVNFYQSNSESNLVEHLQNEKADGFIVNAAAYTHTSIAIRDALLFTDKPFVEVHITNVYKRDVFRQKSYLSDVAVGLISGLGTFGYEAALRFFAHHYSW